MFMADRLQNGKCIFTSESNSGVLNVFVVCQQSALLARYSSQSSKDIVKEGNYQGREGNTRSKTILDVQGWWVPEEKVSSRTEEGV